MSLLALHRRLARDEGRALDLICVPPLAALALVYRGGVACRNFAYDRRWARSRRAPVWVLAVGGLSAGGSGKTPLAASLATRILAWGGDPLLVARGYRAQPAARKARCVSDGATLLLDARAAGEEAVLLARLAAGVPVAIARRREEALAAAAGIGLMPRLLVLDGALQHRRLHADYTVVALDASRPAGTGHLLPWGDLREPWGALRRADALVLHRAELCCDRGAWERFLARHAPDRPRVWVRNRLGRVRDLATGNDLSWEHLPSMRLGLWTGLGHPEAWIANLAAASIQPVWTRLAPDHARVDRGTVERLRRAAAAHALDAILVTEKDAPKLEPWRERLPRTLIVGAILEWETGSEGFDRALGAQLLAAGLVDPGRTPC
jgi:tetraacyldisaccharide 4'-kinase